MRISTPSGSIDVPDEEPIRPLPNDMLGLAVETVRLVPINGQRHPPGEGTSGWYIWGGNERSEAANFFSPIHVQELGDYLPNILPYLDLPPGFRFRIDNKGLKDVWFDASLLDV